MDFYVVLGVAREATDSDIKRAYKRLARRYHPDINPGDRDAALRFRHILDAYETLVDPVRRRRYDSGEPPTVSGEEAREAGFEGFDFSPAAFAERSTTFGDLFASTLTGAAVPRPARGADLHVVVPLRLEDLVAPSRHALTATRRVPCETCAGLGVRPGGVRDCPACEGRGDVRVVRGHMVFRTACGRCGGTGRRPADRCLACDGHGTSTRTDRVEVDVPAGIADGAVLRCAGWGHAGAGGGAPGDLVATVAVAPHDVFRRDGDHLVLDVPVAVHEAALGARIGLPSIDGAPLRLRVPPGTQTGRRFRVRGRGLPSPRDGQRGDVVAEVRIVLPPLLDERAKELLREFGALQRDRVRDARFPADEGGA